MLTLFLRKLLVFELEDGPLLGEDLNERIT